MNGCGKVFRNVRAGVDVCVRAAFLGANLQRTYASCIVEGESQNLRLSQWDFHIHSVSYVYAVLPFYDVKCLCSRGRE